MSPAMPVILVYINLMKFYFFRSLLSKKSEEMLFISFNFVSDKFNNKPQLSFSCYKFGTDDWI